jgi:hypothetical protein|tara:strand:+ start:43 stop:243 length:201 start_codon:yes stop_codon:yes gene_type:complete
MGAVKSWMMDLEEKFWEDADEILQKKQPWEDALAEVKDKLTYPAIAEDNDVIEDQLAERWGEYNIT